MIFMDRADARGERFDDEIKIGDIVAIADGCKSLRSAFSFES